MQHNVSIIDREEETAFLEDAYTQNKSQLIVLYGRRRVGKTYLLQHFMKSKKHAYYLCTKGNETEQIRLLSRMIGETFNDTALRYPLFPTGASSSYTCMKKQKKRNFSSS